MKLFKRPSILANGLPAGFKEVEYIESTGTQYIDTEYKLNNNSVLEVSACSTDASQLNNTLLGVGTSSSSADRVQVHFGSNAGTLSMRLDGTLSANQSIGTNKFISKIDIPNKKAYFNDIEIVSNYTGSIDTTDNVALFNRMISGNVVESEYGVKAKVYHLTISENNALVRDFIPCLDASNTPCMYDLVGKKAYYNLGSGADFTTGRQIIPVEYLESTADEYIDTGIKFDCANTKIEVKTYENDLSRIHSICGDDGNIFYYFRGTGNWAVGYNGTAANIDPYMSVGDNVFVIDKNNVYVNGVLAKTYTASSTVSSYNALLFNRKTTRVDKGAVTMYYCKIWNNDVLVRDYVPVKDENNVGYMLDRVTHSLFENAGTGEFICGKELPPLKTVTSIIKTADLRAFNKLPAGFTEVEYLESTTGQYIDTEVGVKSDTVVRAIFSITSGVQGKSYFGARNSTNERFQIVNSFGVGAGYFYNTNIYPIVDKQFEIEMHASGEVYLDGIKRDATNGTFSAVAFDRTLYIFHTNYHDESGTPTPSKFWKVQILEGNTLVRDYIPCLDPSGKPCMYDRVEGKPYYNASTGEFSYGKKIYYVEYLESTGTQYIDTGVNLNNNSSVELDYQLTQASQARKGLFGNLTSDTLARFGSLLLPSNSYFEHGYGAGNFYWQQGLPDTNRHKLYQKKNKIYFDNNLIHTFDEATFSISDTAPLGNFSFTNYNPASAKYYSSRWWNNDVLIRDFVPVKDENDIGYMLDRVTHTLYGNAGTGSFVCGNPIKAVYTRALGGTRLPIEYKPLKYIEGTGTQYIDTDYKPNQDTKVECKLYNPTNFDTSKPGSILFGARGTGNLPTFTVIGNILNKYGTRWDYGDDVVEKLNYPLTVGEHTIVKDKQYNYLDGILIATNTESTFNINFTMHIFGTNTAGTNTLSFAGRFYYFKIYDNNSLVRHFIPALRKTDNKPGLYDIVNNEFYTNNATSGDDFNYA